MTYQSRWPFSPIHTSIPNFIFDNIDAGRLGEHDQVYIDIQRPDDRYWTLSTYREWSKRLAVGLFNIGFQAGDRLMLVSGNSIFTPIVVMGTIWTGGIYCGGNPGFSVRELEHQMKDCEPFSVLAAPNCLRKATEAAQKVGIASSRVLLFDDITMDISQISPKMPQHWSSLVFSDRVADDSRLNWADVRHESTSQRTAVLTYSSGTTGLPKGVEISHFQIVSNAIQIKQVLCSDISIRKRRALCALPFYHGLGLLYYCILAPYLGIQVFLMDRYNIDDMLSSIPKHSITEMFLVPPMVVALVKHPAARCGGEHLKSVKKVVVGAAPLGREITQQFEELWHVPIRQAWGMSEAPVVSLAWDECEKMETASTSVGELLPGLEARVVDDHGNTIGGVGKPGELLVRGPNIMRCYWRNTKTTEDAKTKDGWLMTGDVAYIDESSKWHIVDRKKELIKVRGAQVAPAELEALLLEHHQIVSFLGPDILREA